MESDPEFSDEIVIFCIQEFDVESDPELSEDVDDVDIDDVDTDDLDMNNDSDSSEEV